VGNRVYLYNLTGAVSAADLRLDSIDQAPESLRGTLSDIKHTEICDTNNTGIPIPWMLYFGMEDFQPAKVMWSDDTTKELQMPRTSVGQARQRILDARPVFERLAGDVAIAKEYWQEALDLLERLPFPFLAMDHLEWLSMTSEDVEADFMEFKRAYSRGVPVDDFLSDWSGYTFNTKPFSHAEWERLVRRFDRNNIRQMNAIAMGYGHSGYSKLHVYEGIGDQSKGPTIVETPRASSTQPT
jgi:hypothetical protein